MKFKKFKKGLLVGALTLATVGAPLIAPIANAAPVMAADKLPTSGEQGSVIDNNGSVTTYYADGTMTKVSSSVEYNVKFMAGYNDAKGKPIEISSQLVRAGANATVPKTPTRTGYTFVKWDKAYTNIKGATVITAVWKAKTTNVTFYRNTSASDTATYKETYTYDKAKQSFGMNLTNKTGQFGVWNRSGYTLLGWSTDKNATTARYSVYSGVANSWINNSAQNQNLYAVWRQTIPTTAITLDKKSANVNVGATVSLKATLAPTNASDKAITWTSSNNAIATVNNGVVKGIKEGTVTITAKNGTKTATATITVFKPGWTATNKKYKYIGKDGKAYTGWHWMTANEGEKTPHWSYFGTDGILRTGWVQLGQGTANPDGSSAKHWSYFGDNGWMRTGWVQFGKGTANPDKNVAKHWSYFGTNGWLRTGLVTFETGTANPDNNTYKHQSYFDGNGWLAENKDVSIGGKTYYANNSGWLTNVSGKQLDGSLWNITGRKTVIIGDSRTVGAYNYKMGTNLREVNTSIGKEYWLAKVGAGIVWYNQVKQNALKQVDKNTDVIWLLGVNDCTWNASTQYNTALRELANKGARVYFVSVNKTNNFKYKTYAFNDYIPKFNNWIKEKIKGSNIKYIDSYNNVNMNGGFSSDKLHFNVTGTNAVMKYVMNAR